MKSTDTTSFTRQQYFNKECSHREYYAQFVSIGTKNRVLRLIGLENLQASKDEHLNDIPLSKWDSVFAGGAPFEINSAMRAAGDFPTMAGLVCIAKEAAHQILER
jgi:hypothetical protein